MVNIKRICEGIQLSMHDIRKHTKIVMVVVVFLFPCMVPCRWIFLAETMMIYIVFPHSAANRNSRDKLTMNCGIARSFHSTTPDNPSLNPKHECISGIPMYCVART